MKKKQQKPTPFILLEKTELENFFLSMQDEPTPYDIYLQLVQFAKTKKQQDKAIKIIHSLADIDFKQDTVYAEALYELLDYYILQKKKHIMGIKNPTSPKKGDAQELALRGIFNKLLKHHALCVKEGLIFQNNNNYYFEAAAECIIDFGRVPNMPTMISFTKMKNQDEALFAAVELKLQAYKYADDLKLLNKEFRSRTGSCTPTDVVILREVYLLFRNIIEAAFEDKPDYMFSVDSLVKLLGINADTKSYYLKSAQTKKAILHYLSGIK